MNILVLTILCYLLAKKSSGGKKVGGDDLFDLLDTSKLNAHLKELMPGLTAKVFRTYNASITLDDMVTLMLGATFTKGITINIFYLNFIFIL